MDENTSNNRPRRERGGIFFPLLLLTAGVLLLLSNFGYLPGGFWGFVQIYWPFLLILSGLDGLIRGNGITASILIAGFGGILLAGNLGYISISAWELLAKAWPLLLIGIGLDIIVGRRTIGRSIVGLALAFCLIAGLVWVADLSLPGSVRSKDFSQKYHNETSLTLNLLRTTGSVEVKAGKNSEQLVEAKLNLLKNEYVEPVVESKPDSSIVTIENSKDLIPGVSRPVHNSAWEIAVNPRPALSLKSEVVVGSNHMDLRGLNVNEVTCSNSIGKTLVYTAETRGARYQIKGGTGQIVIYVPAGAPVKLVADKAIGALSIPDRYVRENGYIRSPSYVSKEPAIEIDVELPIGAIQVVEYSTSL